MSIHFEHSIDVEQSPERVFALLDDFSQTPKWLARCTGIQILTPGPLAVGSKLRYGYREGGRSGEMDGELVARDPGERLGYKYWDKMMEVSVNFHMGSSPQPGAATRLVHTIEIAPKTFLAKLFSPMIRRQLPKQTITAMESLRALLKQQA